MLIMFKATTEKQQVFPFLLKRRNDLANDFGGLVIIDYKKLLYDNNNNNNNNNKQEYNKYYQKYKILIC